MCLVCLAPTHPNGRSSSSQLCLLSIRGDPGLWLAAPFAVGGDERGGVTRGGQTVRLVLGHAPSFCADRPSGAQLDSGAGAEQRAPGKCSVPRPGSPVPSTPERREGLRACYWEGPSELPERRNSSCAPRRGSAEPRPRGCSGLGEPRPALPSF